MTAVEAPLDKLAIAERFVRARTTGTALPDYPGVKPIDLASAYQIQDLAISRMDDAVVGWKVGRIGEADLPRFDVNRIAGPIFARAVQAFAGTAPVMPVFAGGFAAAEAEFLLRIGMEPLKGKTQYDLDEAADLVDAVHVAIEIASSPFPGINAHGPAVTVSDFGNNNGLVIGAAVPHWRESGFERWPVVLEVDGVQVGRATTETMLDGAVGSVRFLLELLACRGIAVPAGTWVSTGAITGVHEVRLGQVIEAHFNTALTVACRVEAART